jgi:hypothetical protein
LYLDLTQWIQGLHVVVRFLIFEFYDNPYLSSIIIESLSQNIFQKLFPYAPHALTFLISPKHLDNNYQLIISYIKISSSPL